MGEKSGAASDDGARKAGVQPGSVEQGSVEQAGTEQANVELADAPALIHTDPQTWVQSQTPHSLRLAELERIILRKHSEVLGAIAGDTVELERDPARPSQGARSWVLPRTLLVLLTLVGAGALALNLFGARAWVGVTLAFSIATVCFLAALIVQAMCWLRWVKEGARWSPSTLLLAAVPTALAGFTTIAMYYVSQREALSLGFWRYASSYVTMLGALWLIMLILQATRVSGMRLVHKRVRALPELKRSRLRAERDAALRQLGEHGLLSAERVQEAVDAPLGALHRLDISLDVDVDRDGKRGSLSS